MNTNNLHQKTNFTAGSPAFKNIPFFLTAVNVPGFSLGHGVTGGRGGTKSVVSADSITWNALSLDLLIDEDLKVYIEMMQIIKKNIDIDNGTFNDLIFDFWIEINNNKGNKILKLEFKNCRIESIGDIQLDTQDDVTEHVINLSILYDYYSIESVTIPTLTV
jgi:hypothetical protein